MKKLWTLLTAASLLSGMQAQNPFFEVVSYQGAFAPAPAARWTDGWANFDPQNTNYNAATVTVNSNITANTTWTSNNVYLLNDQFIYVLPGVTLTIEPGTVIRGTGKGTLIVERGAQIIAQGTVNQPIVFTSNEGPGNRDYGDWGGLVIMGAARHNLAAGFNAEAEGGIGDAQSGRGIHGGTNDDDNSGILSYVRVEFCGISLTLQPNSEINGLSLYSVGRGTQIDHVQVSYSGDDSFEWFGGSVDAKYLVAYRGWDDDFDTDNGYRGRVQFAASIRDKDIADQSGSNGFESDNDADGSGRQPKTAPVFSNVTIVGPLNATTSTNDINSLYRRALHIRRNSGTSVLNSIFLGYPDAGYNLDGKLTSLNVCGDTTVFAHNILAGMIKDFKLSSGDTACIANEAGLRTFMMDASLGNDTLLQSNDANLTDPWNLSNPDLRPAANSPAINNANFGNPKFIGGFLSSPSSPTPSTFSVYPNPASTWITLSPAQPTQHQTIVQLLDMQGRLVFMQPISNAQNATQFSLNLPTLAPGIYMVQLIDGTQQHTQKLIIQ